MSAHIPADGETAEHVPLMQQSVNPKWRAWFEVQPPDVQAAVEAKWAATATGPGVAHDRAYYARLAQLLAWCAETHGYDFT